MHKKSLFLILTLYIGTSLTCAYSLTKKEQLYSLADLKVLNANNDFYEFFAHAKDLRPAKRNDVWNSAVLDTASKFLAANFFSEEISIKDYKLLTKIASWNTLKNDEFFIEKFDLAVSRYFTQCFQSNSKGCLSQLKTLLKKHKMSRKLGIKLAEALFKNNVEGEILFNLILPMSSNTMGEFYCSKHPTSQIIIDKLYSDKTAIRKIHKDCLKSLLPTLKEKLTKQQSPYTRYQTFNILNSKQKITKKDRNIYHITQLIDGFTLDPEQTLMAFETLKKLGDNINQREIVLANLKKSIPLHGKIFNLSSKSAIATLRGLSRYFPEYLDYYSSVCISHLSGKLKTSGGNPATFCHPFFKAASKHQLIPKNKIQKYKKIMTL